MGVENVLLKAAKTVSGVQAYQYRKEAKSLKEDADSIKEQIDSETAIRQNNLNDKLSNYAALKLDILKTTIGVFQSYLSKINIQNKDKYYELLNNAKLGKDEIKTLEKVGMNFSQSLQTGAIAISLGGIVFKGAKKAIMNGAIKYCTASTGVAIKSLSGAAAKNAALAQLGGGAISAGGGGMAAGASFLSAASTAVAAVAAVATVAVISTNIFEKKLTEATDYHAKVLQHKEECQRAWIAYEGIGKRTDELQNLMSELGNRTESQLEYLEPLIYDFTPKDSYFLEVFNKVKDFSVAISKLAQTPIIEEGALSESSLNIQLEVSNVLNKDL